MRVLLTLHHGLTAEAGAPGATLALGAGLERAGCSVEYFGFGEAFRGDAGEGLARQVRFPWVTAAFLRRRAADFDVVDSSTGDAWVWASLGRPGASTPQALITRAHGLEHVVDRALRQSAGGSLSWRYPLYHGGLRLWEVQRSLREADQCVMLNEVDRAWARDRLGVPEARVSVLPNGIGQEFAHAPDIGAGGDGPVKLAFVGSWIARKGIGELVQVTSLLSECAIDFSLAVLGAGREEDEVVSAFAPDLRDRVTVVPRYTNGDLPRLLADREILMFPSHSEGASVALLEAMACGLAPVATRVGSAPETIDHGHDGMLVDAHDAPAIVEAVSSLAGDRVRLGGMRRAAQTKARDYGWDRIARQTMSLYERVLSEESAP